MYLRHFGLAKNPFLLNTSADCVYYSVPHCETMAHLLYSLALNPSEGGAEFEALAELDGEGEFFGDFVGFEEFAPPHLAGGGEGDVGVGGGGPEGFAVEDDGGAGLAEGCGGVIEADAE